MSCSHVPYYECPQSIASQGFLKLKTLYYEHTRSCLHMRLFTFSVHRITRLLKLKTAYCDHARSCSHMLVSIHFLSAWDHKAPETNNSTLWTHYELFTRVSVHFLSAKNYSSFLKRQTEQCEHIGLFTCIIAHVITRLLGIVNWMLWTHYEVFILSIDHIWGINLGLYCLPDIRTKQCEHTLRLVYHQETSRH